MVIPLRIPPVVIEGVPVHHQSNAPALRVQIYDLIFETPPAEPGAVVMRQPRYRRKYTMKQPPPQPGTRRTRK
jgi:hypothetical protein